MTVSLHKNQGAFGEVGWLVSGWWEETTGLWPALSSPITEEHARLQAATAMATIAGAELGILCFFESWLQEQCYFLWLSPPRLPSPALTSPHQP